MLNRKAEFAPQTMNDERSLKIKKDELPERYVDTQRLLDLLFDPESKPSLRWIRTMTATRKIPFVRMNGKVLFNAREVKNFFDRQKCVVEWFANRSSYGRIAFAGGSAGIS